jgi:hypothetical protein
MNLADLAAVPLHARKLDESPTGGSYISQLISNPEADESLA